MNRYNSYKDSGVEWVGEIPKHWKQIKLKHQYKIQKGKIPKNLYDEFTDGLVPYLSMDVLRGSNSYNFTDINDGVLVKKDEILILWDGSNSGEIIKVEIDGILSSTMGILNKTNNYLNNDFSFYQLKYNEPEIRNNTNGMGIPHVDGGYVRNLPFFVPPIQEQEQIVAYLDKKTAIVDTLISSKEKKINILKEKRTALINHVITKGLDPNVKFKDSGFDLIGEIPAHWEMKRVSNFGTFAKGKGIKKDEVLDFGLPCIRYGEIYTKYERVVYETISFINESSSLNSISVSKGCVLFAGSGETIVDIGKSIVWMGENTIYVGGDIITLKLHQNINPLYISYLLMTNFVQHQKSVAGKGEIIVHIYAKNIKEIKTPFPPISEQQKIVEYLDTQTKEIDELILLEQKKIVTLKEYRQALISEVVTGKINVIKD